MRERGRWFTLINGEYGWQADFIKRENIYIRFNFQADTPAAAISEAARKALEGKGR